MSPAPKSDPDDINQEQFDRLLQWFAPDLEKAGQIYERIRTRLIKIFVCRGSNVPQELADKTINRVARKLAAIQSTYTGDPAYYFASVANFIFKESLRKDIPPPVVVPEPSPPDEDEERDYSCLEECMQKLTTLDRSLVVGYYREEKRAKIDHRKKLAEELGLGLNALRIRACRIRAELQKCVELCRGKAKPA
jgi:DNA-directed RNA polymerase specialized sigma24 family protein